MTLRTGVCLAIAGSMLAAAGAPVSADDTGFAYMHDLSRAGGRLCFADHYHYGSGSGRTQALAQRDAIASWSSFTDLEYGSDWARWSRAASKQGSCSRTSSGYECSISARPCK